MVNKLDFDVGDLVMWRPEAYAYRDRNRSPHVFRVSAWFGGKNNDYPCVVWGTATETQAKGCPGAEPKWLMLAEGPW